MIILAIPMARIIDKDSRKVKNACQNVIDSTFAYLNAYRNESVFQKSVKKKALLRNLENLHEILEDSGKLLKIRPEKTTLSYRTDTKMVTIITKD